MVNLFFYRKFNVKMPIIYFFFFNESCSLSKVARKSLLYIKENLGLLTLYSLSHLDSLKLMEISARTGAEGEPNP